MGAAKQAMMEAEDYVWEEVIVEFTCPTCGKLSDGHAEIPTIDEEFSNEISTNIDVQCIECDETFDAEILLSILECSIVLDEYPEAKINFEPAFFYRMLTMIIWRLSTFFSTPTILSQFFRVHRKTLFCSPKNLVTVMAITQ